MSDAMFWHNLPSACKRRLSESFITIALCKKLAEMLRQVLMKQAKLCKWFFYAKILLFNTRCKRSLSGFS